MLSSIMIRGASTLVKEFASPSIRHYATIISEQFEVTPYCSIVINSPYTISVQPLDIFTEQDKVNISVESPIIGIKPMVHCSKNGDTIAINTEPNDYCKDLTLKVSASLKANLDVVGFDHPINIGSFYGKSIAAQSSKGDVTLAKSQCELINISTGGGNIVCKDLTQAGVLRLRTIFKGSITTDRLQALTLRARTINGDISVGSSYCDKSFFETDYGILRLRNLHRDVHINIHQEGLLNIIGLDGILKARIKKGLADIQVARFAKESEIIMEDTGSLILRLSDECQKNTFVKLLASSFVVGGDVKMITEKVKNMSVLVPTGKQEFNSSLVANCKNAHVLVDSSSWSKLFENTKF